MHGRPVMDASDLLFTAARAFAVYILMLVVVRALGKRTIGNFSAFDLLVALMLGEIVDEIIYGDVRFVEGAVATVSIAGLAFVDSWLSYSNQGVERLLEGTPTILVRNGDFDRQALRAERMNENDVMGHVRAAGVQDLREVRLAILERDGSVSVLKHWWAETAVKADVSKDAERERAAALGGDEVISPDKRTDSPRAL
jgi:uncharacterized membrane protein YcaP (DUF421 family)